MNKKSPNLKFLALMLISIFTLVTLLASVSASDSTAPVIGIMLSQDNNLSQHTPDSHSLTIYAHLWNKDYQTKVIACRVDWNDGLGWQVVGLGTPGEWYMLSHTYNYVGLKTVNYTCQNSEGLWSSGSALHTNYDAINIELAAPNVAISMSQDNNLSQHSTSSNSLTVYAHLFNNHSRYPVNECRIDWGDGLQSVGIGSLASWYLVGHTYSTPGLKTITYQCRVNQGPWSSGNNMHINYDTITIALPAPTITIVSPANGVSYITSTILLNATANQAGITWQYSINGATLAPFIPGVTALTGLANGNYNLLITGTNANGEGSSVRYFSVNVDNIPPFVAFNSPQQNANYTNSSVTINIASSGAQSVWFFNGTANETYLGQITRVFSNGIHILRAYANDSAGNLNQTSVTFFVNATVPDTTAPNIQFVVPTTASGTTLNQNLSVNVTVSDPNWANTTLRVYNASGNIILSFVSISPSFYMTGPVSPNGIYFFNATACDIFNNCNSTETRNVTINTTSNVTNATGINAPVINFTNPTLANGSVTNLTFIPINVSAIGLNLTNITIRLYNLSRALINSLTNSNSPFFINFANLTNGTYYFNATACNVINNCSSTETRTITVNTTSNATVNVTNDTMAPVITIYSPNSTITYNSSVPINFSVTDDVNISQIWFNIDGVVDYIVTSPHYELFTNLTNGTHSLRVYANDTSGNVANTNVTFIVNTTGNVTNDTTGPVFNNLTNITIGDNQSLAYNVNATDASGISCFSINDTVNFNINCSGYLRNITRLLPGIYLLNISVNDTLNNINSAIISVNVTNSTVIVPGIVPAINITNPLNGTNYTNATIILNATANQAITAGNWSYSLNGGNNTLFVPGITVLLGISYNGTYNLTIYGTNENGTGNSSIIFRVNTTSNTTAPIIPMPTISIINPTAGNYNYTNINVNINATNSQSVWFSWNATSNQSYTNPVNVTFGDNATYTLTAYANNSIGNITSASVTFRVDTSLNDTTAPIITNITTIPVMPFVNNGTAQTIIINFTSSEYPINVTFNLYNSVGGLVNTQTFYLVNSSALPVNLSLPILGNGNYNLNLSASDMIGNRASYAVGGFTVNATTNPIIDDGGNNGGSSGGSSGGTISVKATNRTRTSGTASNESAPINLTPKSAEIKNCTWIFWLVLGILLLSIIVVIAAARAMR